MILLQGDCINELQKVRDKSISLILSDLPYGITAKNEWDNKIPLKSLWEQFLRIIKDNGVIGLWSQAPFSAELIMSKPDIFRYEWVIEKSNATGFLNANRMPIKAH